MTHHPDHRLRCTAAELDLLDDLARRHLSAQVLLDQARHELTDPQPNLQATESDLRDALMHLHAAADQLGRAYAAARGYVYDLPPRKEAR
jgi:hypothetical protein